MANYYFTAESWGSDYAPENWEEICSAANDLIDQYIAENELDPELDADQIADWSGRLFEAWITNEQLPEDLHTRRPSTKFEIITDTFEFRFGRNEIPAMSADEIFETYQSCDDRITSNSLDPRREASFDTEAEAREAFERDWRDYGETHVSSASIGKLLCGRMAWIEVNEYDEDGEFDQGGDVLELSAEAYEPEED